MMQPVVSSPWFVKKRVGWGLRPGPWQGWTALGVFFVLFVLFAISAQRNLANGIISMVITVVIFAIVVALTSERPGRQDPAS